jgi:phosphatidylserine decarboxylase
MPFLALPALAGFPAEPGLWMSGMNLPMTALSAAVACVLLLAVAVKWKLPMRLAAMGIAAAVMGVVIPFLWLPIPQESAGAVALAALAQVAASAAVAGAMAMICFWRDPERTPPPDPSAILAAADGTVLYVYTIDEGSAPLVSKGGRDFLIEELTGNDLFTAGATVIGIEMNLLNVHVNRCSIGGQVIGLQHIPGRFMSLRREEAPFVNERVTTVIASPRLTLATVQVASRLVRRVESYLTPGQTVSAGQRLGRIRFGSLVAVVLPQRDDIRIAVGVGDVVTAGVSILARCESGVERQKQGKAGNE